MKTRTLISIAVPLALSLATSASADEVSRSGILSVLEPPRMSASYAAPAPTARPGAPAEEGPRTTGRHLCSAGERCEALGTVSWSRPMFRSVGGCDAETVAALARDVGRLEAIEECTGGGDPTATARPLHRPAPSSAFTARRDLESDPLSAALDL